MNFSDSIAPGRREMGGNGGTEVKIELGDRSVEVDGNGDADKKCGGLIEKLTSAQPSGSIEIPRIPRHKRGTGKGYDPKAVSIGPYHHGKKGLEDMEEIKVEYLRNMASRDGADVMALVDKCLECVQKREEDARRYYSKEISNLCSSQFVGMMVLDRCFILELFLISYSLQSPSGETELVNSTRWFSMHVRTDLLLLENQIPYFILEELLQLINVPKIPALGEDSKKEKLLLLVAIYYITGGKEFNQKHLDILLNITTKPVHLLHLYYLFLKPPKPRAFERSWRHPFIHCLLSPCVCFWLCFGRGKGTAPATKASSNRNIPCAKDLRKALVRFEMKKACLHDALFVRTHEGGIFNISLFFQINFMIDCYYY